MRKVIQKLLNKVCRHRLDRALPGVIADLRAYTGRSDTTGTQWITLWMAVQGILRHKPRFILESGTGASTLVLAAAVQRLEREDPAYRGKVISMESMAEWYDRAEANLPDKYRPQVEIILGPREKMEVALFRGFIHSNIPRHDYSFILLDGPRFWDDNGLAFCADLFRIMDLSTAPVIHGVVDGRAHSVFVLQYFFGVGAARYWHSLFAARFSVPRIDFRDSALKTPSDFRCSPLGRLDYVRFRRRPRVT